MKTNDKTGKVVGALTVTDSDELMLITSAGQMVRISIGDIRASGRNTMGVKLIELKGKHRLQAIAPVISDVSEDETENADEVDVEDVDSSSGEASNEGES